MKKQYSEKKLIFLIKYAPISFIIIFSFVITNIFINQKNNDLENELKKVETSFITKNQLISENLVNYIHKNIEVQIKVEKEQLNQNLKEQVTQAYSIVNAIFKENIKNSNQKAIDTILLFSVVGTIIMIILSFYLSNIVSNIFKDYKIKIETEMKKTIEKEQLLTQQSKMATMGDMIGNIAHQWKQPLSLISMSNGLVKINQEYANLNTEEELKKAVENIDTSVEYLSNTIDDFKNFFKPNKEKGFFNIQTLFKKTFKLIDSQLKNYEIEIIKEIDDTEVFGYENELLQVLINILKNAQEELIKRDKTSKRLIFIQTINIEKEFIIKIKDNAGGIAENILSKIFESYFSTKEEKNGTGIGLYMSKQIIENMNGKIKVSNVSYNYEEIEYKGALFEIYLQKKR